MVQKEEAKMTIAEYYNRNIPEYTDTMFLDGYDPTIILAAAHQKMIASYEAGEPEFIISGEEE